MAKTKEALLEQEVEFNETTDQYKEHSLHFWGYNPKCSICYKKKYVEEKEMKEHVGCRWCHGTLTYYAPDGEDDVMPEVCPAVSQDYVDSIGY